MPHYLQQVAYSPQGWEALVANPQNRIEAVRPAIEKLGGKIEAAWFSFGDYDVVVITELPDNVSAAAIAMAFAAGGACKSVQTIPLISPEEATQALKKARECGYRPARRSITIGPSKIRRRPLRAAFLIILSMIS
jgi:uncharacterized protein with GYD domain